jgi:hypothetical protein
LMAHQSAALRFFEIRSVLSTCSNFALLFKVSSNDDKTKNRTLTLTSRNMEGLQRFSVPFPQVIFRQDIACELPPRAVSKILSSLQAA